MSKALSAFSPKGARVAIVGASGAVGREMLRTLHRRCFPVQSLLLLASERSAGSTLATPWGPLPVHNLASTRFDDLDIALFSAGGSVSLEHAPRAVEAGAVVIDNTSAFRMRDEVPLVVPEINAALIPDSPAIIANPNCSTIQLVLTLLPLHREGELLDVSVATYQSVSGAGQKGIDELLDCTRAALDGAPAPTAKVHARNIAFNVVPRIGPFADFGYSQEELKMVHETRKILDLPQLRVMATCVRVPVIRAHSEVVHVHTRRPIDVPQARALFAEMPGLILLDDPEHDAFPTPFDATDRFESYVGRVRSEIDNPHGLAYWIVSDNLLKGAALNAVQIAEAYWQKRTKHA
ncbi:MAG: aspartate-semialdehyde dehydrogenase [Myxococcota bacterium]|jgi:aspartate-semialdehyde dehydrogenase|nr:aspartate-semialdehyde dehydrogenase [Myxococcota bacterium]